MASNAVSYRGVRSRVQLVCEDKSLAVQASKDECDLNVIIKKYLRTGELPQQKQAAYADLSKIKNLQESLNDVIEAEAAFMALPADLRLFFDNDPVKLVEFAADGRNKAKAIELGLIERPAAGPISPSPAAPVAPAGQAATPPSG